MSPSNFLGRKLRAGIQADDSFMLHQGFEFFAAATSQ